VTVFGLWLHLATFLRDETQPPSRSGLSNYSHCRIYPAPFVLLPAFAARSGWVSAPSGCGVATFVRLAGTTYETPDRLATSGAVKGGLIQCSVTKQQSEILPGAGTRLFCPACGEPPEQRGGAQHAQHRSTIAAAHQFCRVRHGVICGALRSCSDLAQQIINRRVTGFRQSQVTAEQHMQRLKQILGLG
jgi:hypothetical protein